MAQTRPIVQACFEVLRLADVREVTVFRARPTTRLNISPAPGYGHDIPLDQLRVDSSQRASLSHTPTIAQQRHWRIARKLEAWLFVKRLRVGQHIFQDHSEPTLRQRRLICLN